jgi:phosphoglycolate phosphatase-like HAD superfamily hydrolase
MRAAANTLRDAHGVYVLIMAQASHAVLFDLDGTLVDSVYQHVCTWHDILLEHKLHVPVWKVHRAIGLPGDRLLAWLLGEQPAQAAALIAEQERRFLKCADGLTPTDGALALLRDLEARDVPFRAVTSASDTTRQALFKALGREVPIADKPASKSAKPGADPILAATRELSLEPKQISFVGDAIWDGEAARRSGVHFLGLRCGGTSDALLEQAGALWVEDAPRDLIGRL